MTSVDPIRGPGLANTKANSDSVSRQKVLVAIASYGTKQDKYLTQLIAEFKRFTNYAMEVVVMTEKPKPVKDAELLVGLPSADPYSLPFAHRELFAERSDDFDIFIYTEDDTLITEAHLQTFCELQSLLKEDETLGFLRSETTPDGEVFVSSINTLFRWLPETVVKRGSETFAEFSNQHSGCFIVTRSQLKKAISSGGFLIPPHSGQYGMLESAATDIYLRCGFRRLLCVSQIEKCILPHLPNKYYRRLGVPFAELIDYAMGVIALGEGGWRGSLFEPRTDLMDFRWSKSLYSAPDVEFLSRGLTAGKRVLVIGATSGRNELWLKENGADVTVVPLDGVFSHRLKCLGFRSVEGSLEVVTEKLNADSFDAILFPDVLHLVENPRDWLKAVRPILNQGGKVVVAVPNTTNPIRQAKDRRAVKKSGTRFCVVGNAKATSKRILREWFTHAGFQNSTVISLLASEERHIIKKISFAIAKPVFASRFVAVGLN
jgi:SAM-dependent methyltransferase